MTTRLTTTVLTGAALGAAVLACGPLAHANEDPAANPPNCSAADLQGVHAGVEAATSAYLFTHPDLNGFVSGLQGLSREQVAAQMQTYLRSHPTEGADLAGIRQPLVDVKNRCGTAPSP